jgi:hypothetical protein
MTSTRMHAQCIAILLTTGYCIEFEKVKKRYTSEDLYLDKSKPIAT